jgi:hypothetical protein
MGLLKKFITKNIGSKILFASLQNEFPGDQIGVMIWIFLKSTGGKPGKFHVEDSNPCVQELIHLAISPTKPIIRNFFGAQDQIIGICT